MSTIIKKRWTAVACSICAVALAVAGIGAAIPSSHELNACASTEETEDCVKVFIGDTNRAPKDYAHKRTAYIKDTAAKNADITVEAVIGLDDYYTIEDIASLTEAYDITINRAYMWPKGETGRLSLYVEDGDIESSIEAYKQEVEENNYCDNATFAEDYQRFLDGEYEVFALTVTASAEALEALNTEADCINYVDVMHNDEVETYAAQAGKAVSYIEFPSKPDGAH